jgi:type II secretory pathway pseudopilin PulG
MHAQLLVRSNTRGFVLPVIMVALVIIGIIAVAALWTSDDERRSGRAFKESGAALYAAESGLRRTLGMLPGASLVAMTPGDSLVVGGGWVTLPNRTSYRGVVYRVDNNRLQQYVVSVQGRRPSQVGGYAVVTALVSGVPVFKYGIFSQGNIVMSGGSVTDGYNSDYGPYNPLAYDSTGSIATNGSITMSGAGTVVNGDASSAGTNSGGTVTGTRTDAVPPFPAQPTLTCPASYTASVPVVPGMSYNAATGVLQVAGGNTLILPAGTYYFSSVILSGNSTLNTANATIYVDNKVDFSGGTLVNSSTIPSNLSLNACGTASSTGWTLSGGAGAYFSVYAPNHPITISGSGDIFGAIVGASLTASGGAKIHYDAALTQNASKRIAIVPGSWAQRSTF